MSELFSKEELRDLELCAASKQCSVPGSVLRKLLSAYKNSTAPAEVVRDAERYRWLRDADVETISNGGVFAGMTPQNYVLSGEDLDGAIDAAQAKQEALS